jgi:hypothetical protein
MIPGLKCISSYIQYGLYGLNLDDVLVTACYLIKINFIAFNCLLTVLKQKIADNQPLPLTTHSK